MNPLRRFRESQGLNQRAFAQRSGLHQPTISDIEQSVRTREDPDLEGATAAHAAKIERAFGRAITVDQILFPGNYMTAEEIQALQSEQQAA